MPDPELPNTPWRLQLLGDLRATRAAREIARFRTRKTGLLLAYLAYYPERAHPRDALVDLFWPDLAPRAGRDSLSTALTWLRRELEPPDMPAGAVLLTDRSTVRLQPSALTSDVAEFEVALKAVGPAGSEKQRAERLARAVDLYRGAFLPGYDDNWIVRERGWLAEQYFQALVDLLGLLEEGGERPRALEYARRGVLMDPLREEAQRELIRLLIADGQEEVARRQYRELERLLAEHLGTEPQNATRALLDSLGISSACADLPASPPPTGPPWHLPGPLTRFIGRAGEAAAVRALLATQRLVTLTGAGGCGKTRLALEVAGTLGPDHPDGLWFVDLAPIADPALLPQAVAAVLGVVKRPDASLTEVLTQHLRNRRLLLLLDNCEHLIEACARLVAALLAVCPRLVVLATSREPLSLAGETRYRVPSLLPEDAIHLFLDRATAVRPDSVLTERDTGAVREICTRLDGIPLAIELASARVGALTVEQIRERLDDRFRLLTGGYRSPTPRHQTLRALIDWSFDLLTEAERTLLCRLSVFAGGWTLEAAEAVCGDTDVLDLLGALVDRSLVQYEPGEDEPRYHMLETVREYARERLAEAGEEARIRGQHRDFFLEWTEQIAPHPLQPAPLSYHQAATRERDNLRMALELTRSTGEADPAIRLALALWPFWWNQNQLEEAERWVGHALAQPPALGETEVRATLLIHASSIMEGKHYDRKSSRTALEESACIWRKLGDSRGLAWVLTRLGRIARWERDSAQANRLWEESTELFRQTGDRNGLGDLLFNRGELALEQHDLETADAFFQEALALFEQIGYGHAIALALNQRGEIARANKDGERAIAFYRRSLEIHQNANNRWGICNGQHNMGHAFLIRGDVEQALVLFRDALQLAVERVAPVDIGLCLTGMACVLAAREQPERSARLFAAAAVLFEKAAFPPNTVDQAAWDFHRAAARAALGESAFAATWAEGQALSLDEAVAVALAADLPDDV